MKKIVRIFVPFLILVMIFSLAISSYAESKLMVSVNDINAKAGDEIKVIVELNNNPGVGLLTVNLKYDENIMTLKKAENGDVLNSFTLNGKITTTSNPIKINGTMSSTGISQEDADKANNKNNGKLAILYFIVNKDAVDGKYPVVVEVSRCVDILNKKVDNTVKSGSLTIVSETTTKPADTNTTTTKPADTSTTTTKPADTSTTTTKPADTSTTTTKPADTSTTTTKPVDTSTTTTKPVDTNTTTTEPSTKDKIPQTGESDIVAVIAGVCVIASVAFVATRKKNEE